ncbi:MAG: pyridoxamine 5'-phosphate oxidase family protein [Thermoanaerobaculia bacterium]
MEDLGRIPENLSRLLGGAGFRLRRRLILPLLTCDPGGAPRATLLTFSEVRALSRARFAVAVSGGSRTEANLIRRRGATLLFLDAGMAISIRARAGRARVSRACPDKRIFPLQVVGVKEDRPLRGEGSVSISSGARFSGGRAAAFFSPALFRELGRA